MNISAPTPFGRFHLARWAVMCAMGALVLVQATSAATFTVTNPNNAGPGSLRDAIAQADINAGDDTIIFDLPGPGPHGILLTSGFFLSSNIAIINDHAGDELVALHRSAASGTQFFRIFTIDPGLTVTLAGLALTNGRAPLIVQTSNNGGAIYNGGSTLAIRSCYFSENSAVFGGAIYNSNHVSNGPEATLTITNSTFTENTAAGGDGQHQGGAIFNTAFGPEGRATVSLNNCILRQNSATTGGGIANHSNNGGATASVTLTNCTLSGNSSVNAGGAIYNVGSQPGLANTRLENCTLEGNQSNAVGGAVHNFGDSRASARVSLLNCTISGNSARNPNDTAIGGAGLDNTGGAATLTNCTFASNLVDSNGQGQSVRNNNGGIVSASNTLFVRNGFKTNFANDATFSSRGHNLANDAAGGDSGTGPGGLLNAAGDIRNTNPLIVALADNGGPTQTRALQPSSPAIDAGDDALARDTDQRGYLRNRTSDIGAFEYGGTLPPPSPTPTPTPVPARLANIATRLRVETGDNVLIGGFIITGTQPKKVIVRGIGTSLPFADRLENPTLELRDASGALLDSNDNWVDSPNAQAISDTTIPPSSNLESAILATLPANNSGYTAIVRGAGDSSGIGVVEAYDLDGAADSKLANISTRGLVQISDNVLIAGMIVSGETPQKVILRAIGPSLPIAGKLEDPTLELRDGNGTVLEANDNWIDSPNKQAIIDSTIPPSDNFESAIVFTLPGNNAAYTAIVRGVGDTTGIAVVEVYGLN